MTREKKASSSQVIGEMTPFVRASRGILTFLENRVWPLRVDLLLKPGMVKREFESQVAELLSGIEANPRVLEQWKAIPAPHKAGEEGDAASATSVERIRLFGPQKARSFLVGALLREGLGGAASGKAPPADGLRNPLAGWQSLGLALGDDEVYFELRLECAVMLQIFSAWLELCDDRKRVLRAKKWLEGRVELWKNCRIELESKKSGTEIGSFAMIFRSLVLLDLGRASMLVLVDAAPDAGQARNDGSDEVPLLLRREQAQRGFCASQVAAVWAQALSLWSNLGTPMRLLLRPWRSGHPQVKAKHAAIVAYLAGMIERGGHASPA